jgi:hypothetical protein
MNFWQRRPWEVFVGNNIKMVDIDPRIAFKSNYDTWIFINVKHTFTSDNKFRNNEPVDRYFSCFYHI